MDDGHRLMNGCILNVPGKMRQNKHRGVVGWTIGGAIQQMPGGGEAATAPTCTSTHTSTHTHMGGSVSHTTRILGENARTCPEGVRADVVRVVRGRRECHREVARRGVEDLLARVAQHRRVEPGLGLPEGRQPHDEAPFGNVFCGFFWRHFRQRKAPAARKSCFCACGVVMCVCSPRLPL